MGTIRLKNGEEYLTFASMEFNCLIPIEHMEAVDESMYQKAQRYGIPIEVFIEELEAKHREEIKAARIAELEQVKFALVGKDGETAKAVAIRHIDSRIEELKGEKSE